MTHGEGNWQVQPLEPRDPSARSLWQDLCEAASGSVVQSAEFVFVCAATMSEGPLSLAVRRIDGKPVAAAIVSRRRHFQPEVFVASQMPLGAWIQLAGQDFVSLATGLLRACGMALRLGVWQVDSRFVPRPHDSDAVSCLDHIETPWLDVSGSFDAYWASRGKNLRTNMRRQRDKLQSQGIVTRMEILGDPVDVERGLRDYAELESRGWKAAGGTAVSADHPQMRFYREMLGAMARAGAMRIYRYFFGEQLVATELCLQRAGELVILKTTYDESVNPFSPASLLRQEMFEGLFARGDVRRVEFYGPLKEWHTRWTPNHRAVYHANVYRAGVVQTLERAIRRRGGASPLGEA